MSFVLYNANPENKLVGDCVIRSISKITNKSWEDVYSDLAVKGLELKDMPSSNNVWANYLYDLGYVSKSLPYECPACFTVNQFADKYSIGKYLVATGTHVVAIMDGKYYDTWDSGNELVTYYFEKR
jgi:hypothetical protein